MMADEVQHTRGSSKLSVDEFQKLTYLVEPYTHGRAVPLFPCFHHEEQAWEMWLPGGDGSLFRLETPRPYEMPYFSTEQVDPADGFLRLYDVALRHIYWPDVANALTPLLEDIHNMGAVAAKLDFFHDAWRSNSDNVTRRFVATELEYLFMLCRSSFDELQKVIRAVARKASVGEDAAKIQDLPRSFADVALKIDKAEVKFGLPPALVDYYRGTAEFFGWLRYYRNQIDHYSAGIDLVFFDERGFLIATDKPPFDTLEIWTDENVATPNRLGSVRSLVAYVIAQTLDAIESLAVVLSRFQLPPDIAPDRGVWIRGPQLGVLQQLQFRIHDDPWAA